MKKRNKNGDGGFWKDGYWRITVNGLRVAEHAYIAEKALEKPLPPKAVVHHVDENKTHNKGTNLVICPNESYHRLLHQRMKALDACGNPNWRKCPYCKTYDDPTNMVKTTDGCFRHRQCHITYMAAHDLLRRSS